MQKNKILLGSLTHLVTDLYSSFIIVMIPVLVTKLGLSLFLVGILTSVNFVSSNFCQLVFGFLSDKYGIRRFLILSPLISSIFISLLGIASAYWVVLIFLFLGNLGVASIHPPSAAIANFYGGKNKGFANSFITFSGLTGFSIGSMLIVFIIEKLGLIFTPLAAIPGIATAAIMVKIAPEIDTLDYSKHAVNFISRLKKVKKTRIGLLFIIVFVAYARDLMTITLLTFTPIYYTNLGVELVNFGYVIAAFSLIGGIAGLMAGFYSDRAKKRIIVIQGLLFMTIPCVLSIFLVPVKISIFFFILVGFFSVPTVPLCIREAQDIFPRNINLVSSLSLGAASGSAAATVILIGKIADIYGIGKTVMFMTTMPVIAIILLFIFVLLKKEVE